MGKTENSTIGQWAEAHNVEAKEVIDFLAANGSPNLNKGSFVPKSAFAKLEEQFKVPEVPKAEGTTNQADPETVKSTGTMADTEIPKTAYSLDDLKAAFGGAINPLVDAVKDNKINIDELSNAVADKVSNAMDEKFKALEKGVEVEVDLKKTKNDNWSPKKANNIAYFGIGGLFGIVATLTTICLCNRN